MAEHVTVAGEMQLRAGTCAGFRASRGDAHMLINRTTFPVLSVEVFIIARRVNNRLNPQQPEVLTVFSISSDLASVCTGAFILAKAGIIQGWRVTTHWEDQQKLAEAFPGLDVVNGRH